MKTLLKNIHTLVTCDDRDRVLHGVDLLIDGCSVAKIGKLDETEARADRSIDAS